MQRNSNQAVQMEASTHSPFFPNPQYSVTGSPTHHRHLLHDLCILDIHALLFCIRYSKWWELGTPLSLVSTHRSITLTKRKYSWRSSSTITADHCAAKAAVSSARRRLCFWLSDKVTK